MGAAGRCGTLAGVGPSHPPRRPGATGAGWSHHLRRVLVPANDAGPLSHDQLVARCVLDMDGAGHWSLDRLRPPLRCCQRQRHQAAGDGVGSQDRSSRPYVRDRLWAARRQGHAGLRGLGGGCRRARLMAASRVSKGCPEDAFAPPQAATQPAVGCSRDHTDRPVLSHRGVRRVAHTSGGS